MCVVGTLRRRSFSLNSQRETSQGSHLEHLRLSRRRLEQGNGRICALKDTGLSTHRVILLYKQAPASGIDRISMILSIHPSSKL